MGPLDGHDIEVTGEYAVLTARIRELETELSQALAIIDGLEEANEMLRAEVASRYAKEQ